MAVRHTSSPPRLVTRFAFRDPSLWRARARLDADHLTLTGWTWRGRYRRRIPLDRILHVDAKGNDELVLWLFDGETLRLQIEQPAVWKAAINAPAPEPTSHPPAPKP